MGMLGHYKLGLRIGAATEVTTVTETMVASPFSIDQLRAKADAIIAARGSSIPYYLLAFTAVDQNRDVKSHVEPFDVATPSDVGNGIYPDDASAQTAATKRFTDLGEKIDPYCYVALYIGGTRFDDHYEPPKEQPISVKRFTTKEKIAAGASLLGVIGVLALVAKH